MAEITKVDSLLYKSHCQFKLNTDINKLIAKVTKLDTEIPVNKSDCQNNQARQP